MTRRSLFRAIPGLAATSLAIRGQDRIVYRNYPRCLPDFLRGLAAEAYTRRTATIRSLQTAGAITERQHWARRTFWDLIGGIPERTPLNLKRTGGFERDRYRVETLAYESRPSEWIAANLYVPKDGTGPFPGVLFQMGHSLNGKASDTYQRCCQGLAQLGFVVLAFDPIGQGERTNYPKSDGLTRLDSADAEHTVPGRQLLLIGETMTRLQVWDAVRSLDVLASQPMVDPKRLASAGQSGGGTLTMMLMAVDERLAVAVVSSGNTENLACAGFVPPGSADDAEQNLIGSGTAGFDRWDTMWPFAPRPLLVLSSAKDFFGTYSPNYAANGREEYGRLQSAYRLLGQPSHLHWAETPLPHGLSYSLRVETYRCLTRWLQPDRGPVVDEPPVAPEPDRTLWAGPTGSVLRDFASHTPMQAARLRRRVTKLTANGPELQRLLGVEIAATAPALRIVSSVATRKGTVYAAEVATADQVWAPAWIFRPKQQVRSLIIAAEPPGRNERWREGDLWQKLAEHALICAVDVRGVGDLRPEYSPGAPGYAQEHQEEENYAWASLALGKSLLGQRVQDLAAITRAVQSHFPEAGNTLLAARGHLTVPALCAGLLTPSVTRLLLSDHLLSWANLLEAETYTHPFANFAPGILNHTDLPELAAGMAPREVIIAGTVDAAGQRLSSERTRETYAGDHVKIRPAGEWAFETFFYLL